MSDKIIINPIIDKTISDCIKVAISMSNEEIVKKAKLNKENIINNALRDYNVPFLNSTEVENIIKKYCENIIKILLNMETIGNDIQSLLSSNKTKKDTL